MYANVTSTRNHITGSSLELIQEAILHLTLTRLQHTSLILHSTGAFCLRVRDFEISYERIRWPAISRNQNNGGLRGEKFRVRVVICVVYLPCLRCRRCQKIEKRLGCLWQNVTAKYFRIIRGNQVVLVWNSHVVSNLAKVA